MRRYKVRRLLVWILAFIMLTQNIAYAQGWKQEKSDWYYEQDGVNKTGWVNDGTGRYHLDENGRMQAGWYLEDQTWYFLNTVHDGYYGRALTDQWAWIDGYCYSFAPDGKMYANCVTPDGYEVNAEGKWTVNGIVQYVKGKGIITTMPTLSGSSSGRFSYDDDDDESSSGSGTSGSGTSGSGSSGSGSGSSTPLPEVEGVKFAKDVKASSLEFTNDEDNQVLTIPGTDETFEKGQIYILHNENGSVGDIAVKVTNVKETSTGQQVFYEQPKLEEVIDSLHISGTETMECQFIPAEGVTVTPGGARMFRSATESRLNVFNGLDIKATIDDLSINGHFQLNSVTYQYNADKEGGKLNFDNCKLVLDSTFTATAAINGEIKKDALKVPIGKLLIPINAFAWLESQANLEVYANGSAGITFTLDSQAGVKYTQAEGIQSICVMDTSLDKAVFKGAIGAVLEIPTTLKILAIESSKVGGEVGIELSGEIRIINEEPVQLCCDAELNAVGLIFGQIGPDELNLRGEFNIFSADLGNAFLRELHIEETGIVPKCTREGEVNIKGSFKGEVWDDINNLPLSDVKMEVRTSDEKMTLLGTINTDENGKFNGILLPAGTYYLVMSHDGYYNNTVMIDVKGEQTLEYKLVLGPIPSTGEGSYEVYVKDSADSSIPINHATIEVSNDKGATVATIYTDENGYYKGTQLPVGNYILHVTAENYYSREVPIIINTDQTTSATVLLDASSSEEGTGSFYGHVGKCHGWDTSIEGSATGFRYAYVSGVKVELLDKDSKVITTVYSDENGYFEGTCPAGEYVVKLSHEDYYTKELRYFGGEGGAAIIGENQRVELDCRMELEPLKVPVLLGTLGGEEGKGVLTITDSNGKTITETMDYNEAGFFIHYDLLPGDYTLVATVNGKYFGTLEITLTRDTINTAHYVPQLSTSSAISNEPLLYDNTIESAAPSITEPIASPGNAEKESTSD